MVRFRSYRDHSSRLIGKKTNDVHPIGTEPVNSLKREVRNILLVDSGPQATAKKVNWSERVIGRYI